MSNAEELLTILEDTASLLQRTQTNLKKCPKTRLTKGYLEIRSNTIEEYWSTFRNSHRELIKITTKEERTTLSYFMNDHYSTVEDLYLVLQADLRDMIHSLDLFTAQPPTSQMQNLSLKSDTENTLVKLPTIQLPTFSGNYEEWQAFQDLFIALVHDNSTISDAQRLHYLKSSVSGEAESLLRHIQITHNNYAQAWEILKSRYGNKRLIVNSILKRLFNQKRMNAHSASQLKMVLDTTTECINNLNNIKISTDSWDPLIIFLVVQKLDPESHKCWEECSYKRDSEELPTWSEMKTFLESKYRALEMVTTGPTTSNHKSVKQHSFHVNTLSSSSASNKLCTLCGDNHTLTHCTNFQEMQPQERIDYVIFKELCFNCLAPGHTVLKCRLPWSCRVCKRRHHTLLHLPREGETSAEQSNPNQMTSAHTGVEEQEKSFQVNTMMTSHQTTEQGVALLATAMVPVKSEQNRTIVLRALIDQGSQASFISEKAAQMLNLTKQHVSGSVIGVGSTRTDVKHVVQLQVGSHLEPNFHLPVKAYVMSKQITTKIPTKTITRANWSHLRELELADPGYCTSSSIDLLLGVKEYAQILQRELIKGPPGTPCAQRTNLGWILFGEIKANPQQDAILVMHHQVEVDMDDMLKSIWEIDTDTKRQLTREEKTCEQIYEKTHTRTEDGRYVVNLPFNTDFPKSPDGNTRAIAEKRLTQLEKRFEKAPKLKEDYTKVLEEYLTLGHMQEVPEIERNTKRAVYLPHHAVVRDDKETSKTRVVFDASCEGTNNISLNDELLVGPQLQEDLRYLIMRWRTKRICYASDIQKMYRQILMVEEHSDYQRILWRLDPSKPIQEYRLLRVTFGTASAPYLAVKTLHQVAEDEGENYQIAAKIIKEDFYMDDLMSGSDTVEEAIKTAREVKNILQKGGFTLSKWSSNNPEFMRSIQPSERSVNVHLDLNIEGTIKALGIVYNLKTDQFEYNIKLTKAPAIITKRNILSDIQKLFDPLGWIAPSVVMAKMLIQKLWLEKLSWDQKVTPSLEQEWIDIRSDFNNITKIKIDRWIDTLSTNANTVQVHGFSDASMRAYAAVAYVKVVTQDGTIKTNLIAARTKVAPLRTVSLPRLELCGALLLSQLLKQIGQAMRIPLSQMYAWTDSSIVLAWLAGEPYKWKPFVANRVVEIIENLNNKQWYHVQSSDNPADIASRGLLLSELKECTLWWKGPLWLSEKEIEFSKPDVASTEMEMKDIKIQVNLKRNDSLHEQKNITSQFENFDTLKELLKTITYCRRFLNYKKSPNHTDATLTTKELKESLNTCIRLGQREEYEEDLCRLKEGRQVKRKSNIKSLNPYMDSEGILRVGGRLRNSDLNDHIKHPIILGANNKFTALIIADAHDQTLHGGVQLMLCYLRANYWILRAKRLVKLHISKCLICARQRATTKTQIMGDLPKERVTPARPFLNSGVDFAGPFQILASKGRGAKTKKAYICIFVCMSTKALHLELVGDMTSEAFIGAFKRFVARRGKCSNIWSDQGRNFVGADRELAVAWRSAQLEFTGQIAESLALDGTQWHFIPAYSPHFGGLWEAGVKSIKYHLKRILTTNLTFEEMTTILSQIEACLNSRPLCHMDSTDTDVIQPLTPGHFLIGEVPIVVPSPDFQDLKSHSLSRWQYTQKLLGDFWRRWQQEYLSRLQQRPKWLKAKQEFELGDIVLIKHEGLPPGKWALGRITDKHPGPDGVTRVYSVKSGDNIVKRPITKLCSLPIDADNKS